MVPVYSTRPGLLPASKAYTPMRLTDDPTVIFNRLSHDPKIYAGIYLTLSPIVSCLTFVKGERFHVSVPGMKQLSALKKTCARVYPLKAFCPNLSTDWGMVIEESETQLRKAELPITFNEPGNVTDTRLESLKNALSAISVTRYAVPLYETESGITTFPE